MRDVHGLHARGRLPVFQNEGRDDGGWGQMVPTTSVDHYASGLALRFGVADGDLDVLFPNLGNYATRNLGFMT